MPAKPVEIRVPPKQSDASPREMANAVRALSMDAIHKVRSGHPGLPMGAADFASVLFSRFLKFDPAHPDWPDRDRFVLSAGHGSMLLYALAYLTGYRAMTLEDLRRFRRLGSKAPGHPELDLATGVEATTGPLGQGLGMAVGMALAERMLRERFGSELVDHRTYALVGDGCLMEGLSYEAAALAGHLGLDRLVVLFDDNGISIDGPVSLATSEDQKARFEACGWRWLAVDGHDAEQVAHALALAQRSDRPTLVACRTVIGYALGKKSGTAAAHGQPPTDAELVEARAALGWPHPPFEIPADILEAWRAVGRRGAEDHRRWTARLEAAPPERRERLRAALAGELPAGWREALLGAKRRLAEARAEEPTRKSSKTVLEALVPVVPELMGGSADLTPSNLARPDNLPELSRADFSGRYLHYGVREHAMAAVTNGIALHKGWLPYCATFLCFADYCRPAIRLSALMGQKVLYVLTHDTITQGPDGPTHEPVEHFSTMRATPGMLFLRPADGVEVAECWELALEARDQPVSLVMTREAVPPVRLEGYAPENRCRRGAYVFAEAGGAARVTLLATGSEVAVALGARRLLEERGVPTRVVSMPCLELFDRQPEDYRRALLGPGTLRVSVEAASTYGWDRYIGPDGLAIGLTTFGASGLPDELMQHFGITPEAVAAAVQRKLNRA
jgi:transketolase